MIHPTAIVDPSAKLHESVTVGPYSIIEENVEIGEGSEIESCVRIYANVKIGKSNKFYHNTGIGSDPQHLNFDQKTKTILEIGDGNVFREGVYVARGTYTDSIMKIGNHNYLMNNTHIGHDCSIGDYSVFATGAAVGGHVAIGNYVFISGLVAIHQFCNIGDYGMAAGLGKITNDLPPYCTADGNPALIIGVNAVGLRRAGFSSETRKEIQNAYKLIYRSGLVTSKAVEKLKEQKNSPEVEKIIDFIDASKRGIIDHV